jgi:2-methylcitrate dehydratase PrpD
MPGVAEGYRVGFSDWLACAIRGAREGPARAAREAGDGVSGRVAAAATAGHVLDYDDTYLPGLAHLSAPTAPAALVLGAELGASVGEVLDAYAAGFEAMGALSRAGHPSLYDRGWHPTTVCGPLGAAVAASRLLELDQAGQRSASALALLRSGGLRSGFGSAGKSLQVGMAAAAGVEAARLAAAGARVDLERVARAPGGFEEAVGAGFGEPDGRLAIEENWIKAYPCCLQTHGAIEAALAAAGDGVPAAGRIEVVVHPVSRQAAPIDAPADGLEAKFSIPYLTGFALLRGRPALESFASVDADIWELGARISVATDPGLRESEAVLNLDGAEAARVGAALGSPQRPMDEAALEGKRSELAGDALEGALYDPDRPAAELLAVALA